MLMVCICLAWLVLPLFIDLTLQIGFELLDAIAEAEGIPVKSVNFKALIGKGIAEWHQFFAYEDCYGSLLIHSLAFSCISH